MMSNHTSSGSRRSDDGGLLSIVKQSFKTDMIKKCSTTWNGDFVLIVDDSSMRVISKAMGMYELFEDKVYLVELLKKKRSPYPKNAPIYFLSPTIESVNLLIADWTPNKSRKEPLYADSVYLYFTSAVPNDLFAKIKACKPLIRRLRAFSEINIDFIACENRVFHFDMKSATVFSNLFQTNAANHNPIEVDIVNKLVTVCASLNEYPHIRYRSSSKVASSIAHLFNNKFNHFVGSNKNWWYNGDQNHTERGRSTILILSRQDDCLSPLLHEFTYQAMVNDLLQPQDDKITVSVPTAEGQEKKDTLLNENDDLWAELRGKHIADVIKILSSRIREIVDSNSSVAIQGNQGRDKPLSMKQMANALRSLPEYKEVMSKLSQHMDIAHRCMDIFNKSDLLNLSDVEQTLATGFNDEGRGVKVSDIFDSVVNQLTVTKDSIDRFRLIAIFIISQGGLRQSDKDPLLAAARLSQAEMKALSSLEKLGYPLVQAARNNRMSMVSSEKLVKRQVKADSDIDYSSSRYVCDLKEILQQSQTKSLSFTDYPSIYPMPEENSISSIANSGVTSGRKHYSKFGTNKHTTVKTTRMIVFVAGGICHSELRAAQEIMNKSGQEVILGSTHLLNPTTFVNDLKSL